MKRAFFFTSFYCVIALGALAQSHSVDFIDEPFSNTPINNYQQTLDSLNQLIQKDPNNSELNFYRAWCYFQRKEVGNAYDDITFYLAKLDASKKYMGHVLLGKIHFERMSPNPAENEFDKAIQIDPNKLNAYLEKSMVYASRFYGSDDAADRLRFIEKAMKKFPYELQFKMDHGILHLKTGKFNDARIDFEYYIKLSNSDKNPSNLALAYFGLAKSLSRNKQYSMAMDQVNKGIELMPKFSEGYGIRGEIKFYQKDYDGSLNDFERMADGYQSSEYWPILAQVFEKKGDISSACIIYGKLCTMFNNEPACSKYQKFKCK